MPWRVRKVGEDTLRHLDALEKWLNVLGMNRGDRIHQAIDTVREHERKFIANPKNNVIGGRVPWEAQTYLNANLEVTEFLDIFDAFKSEPHDLIAPKIRRASSGSFKPVDERPESADARNIQFELSLAAEWRLNGLSVTIGEPDFILSAGATDFIVECKRPYSEGSIRSNIRSAKRQLSAQLDNSENAFGAIAISVGRILVPPGRSFFPTSWLPSVQRDPERHLRALLAEQRQTPEALMLAWQKGLGDDMDALAKRVRWTNFDFHERVVAVFFHAAPPFMNSRGMGRMALLSIGSVGVPGPAFTYLDSTTLAAYGPESPMPF